MPSPSTMASKYLDFFLDAFIRNSQPILGSYDLDPIDISLGNQVKRPWPASKGAPASNARIRIFPRRSRPSREPTAMTKTVSLSGATTASAANAAISMTEQTHHALTGF